MLATRTLGCLRRAPALAPRLTASATPPTLRLATGARTYALSRFPGKQAPGTSRARTLPRTGAGSAPRTIPQDEEKIPASDDTLWAESAERIQGQPAAADPEESLRALLMADDYLVITRQIEMMNIFLGFEQANRYVISNEAGEPLGYIVEEPRGLLASFGRQLLRTHRPFRALVLDLHGAPLLWIRRPFAWINSRMFVQRLAAPAPAARFDSYGERMSVSVEADAEKAGEPLLATFAECQQRWHPWRRRYDLFVRDVPRRVLEPVSASPEPAQPDPEVHEDGYSQVAEIDAGLLAWHFAFAGADGGERASVSRRWGGLGREVFTDTGAYFVRFGPAPVVDESGDVVQQRGGVEMTLEERALALATAVTIDYDYFSRHSSGGGGGFGLMALFALFE